MTINIPTPIEVVSRVEFDVETEEIDVIVGEVRVGGIPVLTERYAKSETFEYAEEQILIEFGNRLKSLFDSQER